MDSIDYADELNYKYLKTCKVKLRRVNLMLKR